VAIFSGSHIGNADDLLAAITRGKPLLDTGFSYAIARPKQLVWHEVQKAKAIYRFKTADKLELTLSRQFDDRTEQDVLRAGTVAADADQRLKLETYGSEAAMEHWLSPGWHMHLGVAVQQKTNIFSGRFLLPNFQIRSAGGFATTEWTKNKWTLEAGFRIDWQDLQAYYYVRSVLQHPKRVYTNPSQSISAAWKANSRWKLSMQLATAWRAPYPNELFSNGVHHGAAAFEIGDSNLVPERSVNLQGAVVGQPVKWCRFEAIPYVNRIAHFIYQQASLTPTVTIRGAFPTFNYRQANTFLSGLDVQADFFLPRNFQIQLLGSTVRGRNLESKTWLPYMPPDRLESKIIWKRKTGKWQGTFIEGSVTAIDKQNRYETGTDYAPPPSGYLLLSTRLGTTLLLGKHSLEITFIGNNLANTRYRDYLNRFRYYAIEQGRNFYHQLRFPLGLKATNTPKTK